MARIKGPSLGTIIPDVLKLRDAYVAHRQQFIERWGVETETRAPGLPFVASVDTVYFSAREANAARWTAERALWEAGETFICRTSEIFDAASEAGLDWRPFTYAHDRADSRLWQVPGVEGGPLVEVAIIDGEIVVIGPPDDPRSEGPSRSQIARMGGNARWQNSHG